MTAFALLWLWMAGGAAAKPRPAAVPVPSRPAPHALPQLPSAPNVPARHDWARDPFTSLEVRPAPPGAVESRPPGKRGLGVHEIVVRAVALGGPNGPAALVAAPDGRTYLLRPGDQLYDASVLALDANGIWFRPTGRGHAAPIYRKIT